MPFGVPDFAALHIEQGYHYFLLNDFDTAIVEFDQALQFKDSDMARYDRALALLAAGRYTEAWRDLSVRYKMCGDNLPFTENGRWLRKNLPHWNGEKNRRVVVLAEGGFGDTIMLLRYLEMMKMLELRSVTLEVPEPLRRLAKSDEEPADCWTSFFDLPAVFDPVIPPPPYLVPDPDLVATWSKKIANGHDRRIGIVWDSNTSHIGETENQTRSLPLEQFLELLPFDGGLFSLQSHDRDKAERLGVHAPELSDFADVAALASLMDVIVSIDTAALHAVAAIGHPRVYAILPWAATWRWHAGNRWYPQIHLCRSQSPGDWSSAFEQISVASQGRARAQLASS